MTATKQRRYSQIKGQKGRQHPALSQSLSSSSSRKLAHFLPALPAVSHTVSSDFPEEHSEGKGFTGGLAGTDAAAVSGSIPFAAQ